MVPQVDTERCTGCFLCVHVCPIRAISVDSRWEVAMIDKDACIGCNCCLAICENEAIDLSGSACLHRGTLGVEGE
ncbi:MAG: 4Fe-4S binding protein [Bacillota bacterium]